jgi:hypothetical protein
MAGLSVACQVIGHERDESSSILNHSERTLATGGTWVKMPASKWQLVASHYSPVKQKT